MSMMTNRKEWDKFLSQYPNAHFLQSGAWGELKARFGWRVAHLISGTSGAQLLFRPLPLGYSIAYLPKGPLGDEGAILPAVEKLCRENNAVFLKIEPDVNESNAAYTPGTAELRKAKPIQPRRTVVVSLEGSEDDILGRMKQKTRYNIRLAEKKGVVVKATSDVSEFHEMAQVTSSRNAFGVHSLEYYQAFYDLYHPAGDCELLTAFYGNQALASVFVLSQGERAYYLYGASSNLERNRMPAYLVQWAAMKWARERGCLTYDMWGIPDVDEQELETSFTDREAHDGLWGVYRFKRGFGGEVERSAGAWDRVYHPALYQLYSLYMRLRGGQAD
jgi:lipid II:glycine glycyltransferase (peptidoglycan interpeptide bridge formation enzyme)